MLDLKRTLQKAATILKMMTALLRKLTSKNANSKLET